MGGVNLKKEKVPHFYASRAKKRKKEGPLDLDNRGQGNKGTKKALTTHVPSEPGGGGSQEKRNKELEGVGGARKRKTKSSRRSSRGRNTTGRRRGF